MHTEVVKAAAFVAGLLNPAPSATFTDDLAALLETRYEGHWHQDDPERGSAYRCIVQNGPDRPEPLVTKALVSSDSGSCASRIPRWTVFVDPGCVSARLGDGSEGGHLQEVYGTLPSAPSVATVDTLMSSPTKRSRAIQIVRPDSRNGMLPVTPGQHVAVIPPTPLTARPMPPPAQPVFTPASEPFPRPSSRSSTASSDGTSSDLGSVFSATSHETLFPASLRQQAQPQPKRAGHHRHTSSVTSTTSSIISRPSSAGSGNVVQEHSNGKVGVLGGGVLLGVPSSGSNSSSDESTATSTAATAAPRRRREGRGRSRARSANYHAQQNQAMMNARWYAPGGGAMDAGMAY